MPYNSDNMTSKKEADPPALSVVMPLRGPIHDLNYLKFLVHEAKRLEIEFIVVHDKHDEQTGIQLRELLAESQSGTFKLFESVFNSPGLARNAGLLEASGEWIAFWDSDDQPNPEEFIEMVRLGKLNLSEAVIGNFSLLTKSIESRSRADLIKPKKIRIIAAPGLWRMAFTNTIAKECHFIPSLMGEDQLYLVDLKLFDRNIYWHNQCVYKYKTGEANQLTESFKNVNFLYETVNAFVERSGKLCRDKSNFGILVLYKLLLTGILRGNLRMKVRFSILLIVSSRLGIRRILKNHEN